MFSSDHIKIFHSTVMVSIWEGNQCKKAQLTLMEISATIANKVVSQSNNTQEANTIIIINTNLPLSLIGHIRIPGIGLELACK